MHQKKPEKQAALAKVIAAHRVALKSEDPEEGNWTTYLTKFGVHYITSDNFFFTTRPVLGQFIVSEKTEADKTRQEKEFAMFTENYVNKESARLNGQKLAPKVLVASTSSPVLEEESHQKSRRLTKQEESMTLQQMDALIGKLHQDAQNINQKTRFFPTGTNRLMDARSYEYSTHRVLKGVHNPSIIELRASKAGESVDIA
ncbi:hypothetical protein GCK72_022441 [Caenorhabditis remanei]|uniref:Uncharacterized protein n=1 Tax=Caenorhabditis remanei TaxID=31234 RepID=A0A6A5FUD0_CAERE|nr:hypothetical protein GCK72_022441 [Caenorhabditis remanei]KAF1745991.1 hypothetical protein GCK72_022441 [Caenorhabditis remanei]